MWKKNSPVNGFNMLKCTEEIDSYKCWASLRCDIRAPCCGSAEMSWVESASAGLTSMASPWMEVPAHDSQHPRLPWTPVPLLGGGTWPGDVTRTRCGLWRGWEGRRCGWGVGEPSTVGVKRRRPTTWSRKRSRLIDGMMMTTVGTYQRTTLLPVPLLRLLEGCQIDTYNTSEHLNLPTINENTITY